MKKITALILTLFAFACIISVNFEGNNSLVPQAQAKEYRQVNVAHILVPTEQQALEIRKEIMRGQNQQEIFNNFLAAAKKYSKCPSASAGGILGYFGKGDMVPEFEKAAFELPMGEVSQPIKTPYGWHLIYVIGKK